MRKRLFQLALLGAAPLSTGACTPSDPQPVTTGADADPALTSALEDQILVDPTLTQQSNKNAVRPPERPAQAQYPAPAGPPKPGQAPVPAVNSAGCATGSFDYDPQWARRLPPEFAVYPGGRLTESAANNGGVCRMRVVTFTSADPAPRVLDWYRGRVLGAGYSADQRQRNGDQILAGSNGQKGSAYYLIVTPKSAGSEVALIVNGT